MPTVERRVWIELALEGRDSINHVKKACGTPKSIGAVKGCRSEWKAIGIILPVLYAGRDSTSLIA